MRRDDDLIRQMLLEFEADEDWLVLVAGGISGETPEDRRRRYHMMLMEDDGMMVAVSKNAMRLTASGHDYLDAIRSQTIWNKTKEAAATLCGASLGMLRDLALAYVKQAAQERLGINF